MFNTDWTPLGGGVFSQGPARGSLNALIILHSRIQRACDSKEKRE